VTPHFLFVPFVFVVVDLFGVQKVSVSVQQHFGIVQNCIMESGDCGDGCVGFQTKDCTYTSGYCSDSSASWDDAVNRRDRPLSLLHSR
jgi:hypothetical protein